jgi:hypothetical protein
MRRGTSFFAGIARQQRRVQRAALAMERAQLRNQQIANKLAQQDYVASRSAEADAMTEAVKNQIEEISTILQRAIPKFFAGKF